MGKVSPPLPPPPSIDELKNEDSKWENRVPHLSHNRHDDLLNKRFIISKEKYTVKQVIYYTFFPRKEHKEWVILADLIDIQTGKHFAFDPLCLIKRGAFQKTPESKTTYYESEAYINVSYWNSLCIIHPFVMKKEIVDLFINIVKNNQFYFTTTHVPRELMSHEEFKQYSKYKRNGEVYGKACVICNAHFVQGIPE